VNRIRTRKRPQSNPLLQASEVYKKFRFTLRFLLGNLHDFHPTEDAVDFEALPMADRYMLHRLGRLLEEVQASYTGYQFFRTYQVTSPPPTHTYLPILLLHYSHQL